MKTVRLPLRIVFYYESDRWVAHCLEFDLLGDGDNQADALKCLSKAIELQVGDTLRHNNPKNLFTPAEGKYFHMFAKGKSVAAGELHIRLDGYELDAEETREYEFDETPPTLVTA